MTARKALVQIGNITQETPAGDWALGALGAGTLTKAANYAIAEADVGRLFVFGAAVTLTLPPIASVGDGFVVAMRSPQATNVVGTLVASGSDPIDNSLATLRVLPGQHFFVMSDGTGWRSFGRESRVLLNRTTFVTNTAAVAFTLPGGYEHFELLYQGVTLTGSATLCHQLSFDGSTYAQSGYTNIGVLSYGSTVGQMATATTSGTMSGSQPSQVYYGASGRMTLAMGSPSIYVPSWRGESETTYPTYGAFAGYQANTARPLAIAVQPTANTMASGDFQLYGLASP